MLSCCGAVLVKLSWDTCPCFHSAPAITPTMGELGQRLGKVFERYFEEGSKKNHLKSHI